MEKLTPSGQRHHIVGGTNSLAERLVELTVGIQKTLLRWTFQVPIPSSEWPSSTGRSETCSGLASSSSSIQPAKSAMAQHSH